MGVAPSTAYLWIKAAAPTMSGEHHPTSGHERHMVRLSAGSQCTVRAVAPFVVASASRCLLAKKIARS
jgi:hypothetical protein